MRRCGAVTAGQLRIATGIDAKMQELTRGGRDDMTIFATMACYMPDFKRLMNSAKLGDMDELGRKFTGFYRYARILETIATGVQSGAIKMPKD